MAQELAPSAAAPVATATSPPRSPVWRKPLMSPRRRLSASLSPSKRLSPASGQAKSVLPSGTVAGTVVAPDSAVPPKMFGGNESDGADHGTLRVLTALKVDEDEDMDEEDEVDDSAVGPDDEEVSDNKNRHEYLPSIKTPRGGKLPGRANIPRLLTPDERKHDKEQTRDRSVRVFYPSAGGKYIPPFPPLRKTEEQMEQLERLAATSRARRHHFPATPTSPIAKRRARRRKTSSDKEKDSNPSTRARRKRRRARRTNGSSPKGSSPSSSKRPRRSRKKRDDNFDYEMQEDPGDMSDSEPSSTHVEETRTYTSSSDESEYYPLGPAGYRGASSAVVAMQRGVDSKAVDEHCMVCGRTTSNPDNDLVFCDGPCGRAYHQACRYAYILPQGKWFCSIDCEQGRLPDLSVLGYQRSHMYSGRKNLNFLTDEPVYVYVHEPGKSQLLPAVVVEKALTQSRHGKIRRAWLLRRQVGHYNTVLEWHKTKVLWKNDQFSKNMCELLDHFWKTVAYFKKHNFDADYSRDKQYARVDFETRQRLALAASTR